MGRRAEWCSIASGGQCWQVCNSRVLCIFAMCPLSEGLFEVLMRCSVPIVVALLRMGYRPNPSSVVGLWIASVGKPGVTSSDWRAALFKILSIFKSRVCVKMPRCVAWYLDLRSCYMIKVFLPGESLRLCKAVASLRTSLVVCATCSLKSSTGLMWTPSIL